MTTSKLEGECYLQNPSILSQQINQVIEPILPEFDRMMRSYAFFNMAFLIVGFLEIVLLAVFFTFLAKSLLLAFGLALLFSTYFSYFIVKLYYQTKKPEQFQEIKNRFVKAAQQMIGYREGEPEHHIALGNACCKLAEGLNGKEYTFYTPPSWLGILSPYLEKFSWWWHWQDIHRMKEILLMAAVEEHIKLVKCEPTSLEAHASLANAYVMLSALYADPSKQEDYDGEQWVPSERYIKILQKKFRDTAERAIEEFKIISDYAPNDPWVHEQLAYSYRDLQMPQDEIKEYEVILKLTPEDYETLFKLGVLYFKLGRNAQGLQVYEQLKRTQYKKAEALIKHYGAYTPS